MSDVLRVPEGYDELHSVRMRGMRPADVVVISNVRSLAVAARRWSDRFGLYADPLFAAWKLEALFNLDVVLVAAGLGVDAFVASLQEVPARSVRVVHPATWRISADAFLHGGVRV